MGAVFARLAAAIAVFALGACGTASRYPEGWAAPSDRSVGGCPDLNGDYENRGVSADAAGAPLRLFEMLTGIPPRSQFTRVSIRLEGERFELQAFGDDGGLARGTLHVRASALQLPERPIDLFCFGPTMLVTLLRDGGFPIQASQHAWLRKSTDGALVVESQYSKQVFVPGIPLVNALPTEIVQGLHRFPPIAPGAQP